MWNKISISGSIGFRYISAAALIFIMFGVTTSAGAFRMMRYVAKQRVDLGNCSSAASPCYLSNMQSISLLRLVTGY